MLARIVGGLAFGAGALLLLGTLITLITAFKAKGNYSGYGVIAVLMIAPFAILLATGIGVLGWFTLMETPWARISLEILFWALGAAALVWAGVKFFKLRPFSKRDAFHRAMRIFMFLALPNLLLAILLRLAP